MVWRQLPAAASSLAATVLDVAAGDKLPWLLASSGFRDSTRIADSTPEMWVPILLENASNVERVVDAQIRNLEQFRDALNSQDSGALRKLIERGQSARVRWRDMRALDTTESA
jgi:prephenate dehydrogenase